MTLIQHGGGNRFSVPTANPVRISQKAAFVKFDGQKGLILFGVEKREQGFEDGDAFSLADLGYEQLPMFCGIPEMSRRIQPHCKIKDSAEKTDGTGIGHLDAKAESIARRTQSPLVVISIVSSLDRDTAFSVEQSGTVRQGRFGSGYSYFLHLCIMAYQIHKCQESLQKKSANSVEPLPGNAEGNTEPSIPTNPREGVCREHGQTPKGMMCSELCSNTQSAAEMTAPLSILACL